jgi:hypothetical protein
MPALVASLWTVKVVPEMTALFLFVASSGSPPMF